jgi:hypothetical protein
MPFVLMIAVSDAEQRRRPESSSSGEIDHRQSTDDLFGGLEKPS